MTENQTSAPENPQGAPKKPFSQKLDKFFGIAAAGSTVKTEIYAGLTTFFAMCYIMLVNPSQMSGGGNPALMNALFIATGLGAIVGTLLMSLYAKTPYAQAPGMGLNAFFFVSFMVAGFGSAAAFSNEAYAAGLSVIFVAGLLFFIISVTGIRKKIAQSMPMTLKKAIPAGIGLFIALIALKTVGLVQFNPYTLVQMGNFNIGSENTVLNFGIFPIGTAFETVTWYGIVPAIVAFLGLLLIGLLQNTKARKSAVIIGILACTGLYYLFNIGNSSAYGVFTSGLNNPFDAFGDFGKLSIGKAFTGFQYWTGAGVFNVIMLVITFALVDMFDTFGTLQGTATEAGMLDANGDPLKLAECCTSDAIATVVGAVFGTSTVTTYVESAAGVSAGGRTGLTSLVVTGMFFIALFLSPLAAIIPSAATAPALLFVGVMMLKNFKDIDFTNMTNAIPAFLTLIMMPLTYSISNGIAFGMISYSIMKILSIRSKDDVMAFLKNDSLVLVLAIIFTLRFFLVTM